MMRKENSIRVSVILIATSLMCSIAGCNRTPAPTTEIAGAKTTENSEYTGRGNQNELLLALMIDLNENDTISLKDITLIKDAATQRSDVKAIKVYYTGQLDTLDTRTLHDALLLGKGSLSKKKTKIALSGDLKPGRNYLWVTADIADDATEEIGLPFHLPPSGTTRTKGSNMNRNRQRAGRSCWPAGCYLLPATTIPTFTGSRPSLLPKMVLSSRQPTSARRICGICRRISTWLSAAAPITVKRGANRSPLPRAKDTARDTVMPLLSDSTTASFSASLGE